MTYIIENANILKHQKLQQTSLLITEGKIMAIKQSFNKYLYMKMDASPFIMTPTSVLYAAGMHFEKSFVEMKDFYQKEFLLNGCTAFLTYVPVKYEYELKLAIKRMASKLLNSPIDYLIGVKIPIRLLTPAFMRQCKQAKVPAIFVEIQNHDDLSQIPWGWIREALYPFNSPLIPIYAAEGKEKKRMMQTWKWLMEEQKIPSLKEGFEDFMPIPFSALCAIGIFPLKANIGAGFELSYNLYWKSREIAKIEELSLYDYHRDKLVVTIHRGDVIRVDEKIIFRPGFGRHEIIRTPSFLISHL